MLPASHIARLSPWPHELLEAVTPSTASTPDGDKNGVGRASAADLTAVSRLL